MLVVQRPMNNDDLSLVFFQTHILDIKKVKTSADGSIQFESYMDAFPFPFYLILRDINSLPMILSDALRQWFELVTTADQ